MAWGAAWMHRATGKRAYLKQALRLLEDSRKHEPSRCCLLPCQSPEVALKLARGLS